jgi:hypothetical protein
LLVLLVVSLPLMDFEVFQFAGKSIVLPYVVVMLLALAVLTDRGVLHRQLREDRALPFLTAWLAVAAVAGGLAFARGQDNRILASNASQFANLAFMGIHYAVVAAALRALPDRDFGRLRDIFILTACAGGVLSVWQVGSVVFGWPYVDWLRTSNLYFKSNTLNSYGGGSWISFPRAFGAAPEPTFWAGYLAVALCFSIARLRDGTRLSYLIQTTTILVGLGLTFSRAAAPPLAAACAVWALCGITRRAWVVPATVAGALCIAVLPAFLDGNRLLAGSDLSAMERFAAQVTGLHMVRDYPALGVGPGSVPSLIDEYLWQVDRHAGVGFSRLYSFILSVIVTTGLLGTALFAAFLIEVGRQAYRGLTGGPSAESRTLALSSLLAFVCVVVYWVGSPAYNMSFLWFPLAFGSALGTRSSARPAWSASV